MSNAAADYLESKGWTVSLCSDDDAILRLPGTDLAANTTHDHCRIAKLNADFNKWGTCSIHVEIDSDDWMERIDAAIEAKRTEKREEPYWKAIVDAL